ncbi:MAG: fluoride efflux transporter CrcB [Arcobacter sp.]|uniref:fluoride efflux transporter CrcB n=1 Tax=uncultured Arcobacter sp. TaxID=165434 RepID=UPI000CB37DB7|nr:fluoride efflux transporter CrcB [uncultured Arcobacter sp.]PLY08227.1 MAG: fluoride efflux transporter CrcB [Arcobacter sp.]
MTLSWQTILAVGCGGFLGAVARVYVTHSMNLSMKSDFPWGVLTVNIIGSFLIGILFAIFVHYTVSDTLKAFLTSGFLGALTTYSTFAMESFFLLNSSLILGATNMFLNLFGTIVAAGSGYKLLSFLLK